MLHYFAPMEGLTDSIYRRVHHKHFGGVDRYYMPFFSPTIHRCLTRKEDRELPIADSVSFNAVPQIMTKVPEDFLWAAQVCRDRGYDQVNLNIGCPSGTVVAKGKGAGMLRDLDALDRFFDAIFFDAPLPISVKTRLGVDDDDHFPRLMEIFNRYPIYELTIHPRVRKDFYKNPLHMGCFDYAVSVSKNPLCFNGDLCSLEDINVITNSYPQLSGVMLGRGLIADPGMLSGGTTIDSLKAFHDELLDSYTEAFGSQRNAMSRLKENWFYLAHKFDGGDKLFKALRKSTDFAQYQAVTEEIFQTLPLLPSLQKPW